MLWLSIIVFVIAGIALIIWRKALAEMQALYFFGASMPPGCAVAEGVAFFLLALAFYLAHRAGLL